MYSLALKKAFYSALIIFLFGLPLAVFADTLSISPSSGEQAVGKTFAVRILVSSPARSINAVSGTLSFPTDKLQVVSVSKANSILTLWVQEPSFSNVNGTVTFEGVVPNPGYIGAGGTVLTINFRPTSQGTAGIRLSAGSILANDGLGTNVLKTLGTGSFNILAQASTPAPAVAEPAPPTFDIEQESYVEPVIEETPSEPVVQVQKIGYWALFKNYVSNLPGLVFLMAIPLVFLVILLMYGRNRFVRHRRRVRKETEDVEHVLHHSFDTIKEDIVACVGLLEKANMHRRLSHEERAVFSLLKQHLVATEKLVSKEIHDIRDKNEK